MPTTATLAPPVTISQSGGWPSHFVNQNKTAHNFAPYTCSLTDWAVGLTVVGCWALAGTIKTATSHRIEAAMKNQTHARIVAIP
jgi:hypothetical protein